MQISSVKPHLSFWQLWNMSFGFFGIQFGFTLQNANTSRIFSTLGAEMGDYCVATTTESKDGRPTQPGHINGGFFARKPDWPAQVPSVVIGVGDIRAAMAQVAAAGGQVLGEPMDIPGVGAYVSFNDTEGNRVSMLQPLPRPG